MYQHLFNLATQGLVKVPGMVPSSQAGVSPCGDVFFDGPCVQVAGHGIRCLNLLGARCESYSMSLH